MRGTLTKIAENARLLFHPVIINGFVNYNADGSVRTENWGDDINYYFLKDIVRRPVVMYNRSALAFRLKLKNYLCIGSTIDMLCKENTEVWGAGIIDGTKPLRVKPRKVHAVRGPLTRQALLKEGVDCPEVYGDPAMLIARYYRPQVQKKYRYAFIPHVSNAEVGQGLCLGGRPISERADVLTIDLRHYDNWHDVIDRMLSCEVVLSSSLHGLIMAEAYGLPNVWLEFGRPLIGSHFKFHDFFLSLGHDRPAPVKPRENNLDEAEIAAHCAEQYSPTYGGGNFNLEPLIEACPFALRKTVY